MPQTDLPKLPPIAGDEPPTVESATTGQPRRPSSRPADEKPRSRPAAPRRPREPERPLASAGEGLIVLVLALVLGLVLTAPGAHKRAYNEPDGWKRDVTLAVTGPLEWVSQTLLLDRPRAGVQALAGRSGADEIDTEIGIDAGSTAAPSTKAPAKPSAPAASNPPPKQPSAPTEAAAKQPSKSAFSPSRKLRIWVAGDSLAITPGYAIVRAAGASAAMTTVGTVDGRVSTGLTRPDVFNWFKEIRSQLAELRPDVVVLVFGGNDDKAYMTGLPEGVSIGRFGDAAWVKEYRRRVRAIFDAVAREGGYTVWIGLPQTRSSEQTQRFDIVNAAVAAEARRHPRSVAYIDTYLLFAGSNGGYAEYLPKPNGNEVRVRASDGVHFEREGGDMIAREVLGALNRKFDLTSWKRSTKTSP